jgi:prolyl 4-hydroxylase
MTSYSPNSRDSETRFLTNKEAGSPGKKLTLLMEKLSGLGSLYQEELQVAKYEQGGKFDPHTDACDQDDAFCERFNKGAKNRYATLLVYLNDDYEGGQTVFTNADIRIQPKKGKAIFFIGAEFPTAEKTQGRVDMRSVHTGTKVLRGVKWICTKWVHFGEWPQS